MKYSFLIFCTLSTITPSLNHAKLWNTPSPKKVITISPEDRIIHLELNADQNGKKARGGFAACVVGATVTLARLCERKGKVEKYGLGIFAFAIGSGIYSGWCAWSQYSSNQEAEDLKEEYNITVRYTGDEDYLEKNTRGTQTDSD